MSSMECDLYEEEENPNAFLTGIKFHVSTDADNENMSTMEIAAPGEVSDPRLGFPNFSNHCATCDATNMKQCEGHFGVIKFPYTGANTVARLLETKGCKYCVGNSIDWYPLMRFKITSKELFRKSAIMVEVSENSLMKVRKRGRQALPADYWDFIPKDQQQEEGFLRPLRRALSHSQDERTRVYKKLVDFRGLANELGSHLHVVKPSNEDSSLFAVMKKNKDSSFNMSGLRYMKDVILGKRNDHCFRMVLTGNPNLKLYEIGIPCHVAEKLQIVEQLNRWNEERLKTCCNLRILEKGEIRIRRDCKLVRIRHDEKLINGQIGRNLLSLSHDSLTAAYLVKEDGVILNLFQMQQLEMFCPNRSPLPAIVKAPSCSSPVCTGKQLFSMLFPPEFDYVFGPSDVVIHDGELICSSEGSTWLRDVDGNLFQSLIKYYQGEVLDFLYAAQEVLCEWLSMRGLSVSLLDIYLSPDLNSQKNMMDEIFYGLQEAEQTCNFKQLMVDSYHDPLAGNDEEINSFMALNVEWMCYEKQRSAALSQVSVDSFKQVFRDIQNLLYNYANKDNSLFAVFKAGSKGNLLKLVQHSMCLGVQHALVPLSFRFPHQLSCSAWNNQKSRSLTQKVDDTDDDNADLPGTLSRRLMFFMRDLCTSYDGTVRNAYGDQVVQFCYNIDKGISSPTSADKLASQGSSLPDGIGGQPVGSLSACAISEAAYSALDQPISLLESSPLLNLKVLSLSLSLPPTPTPHATPDGVRVLECGSKRSNADQTMSLFLSGKLGRRRHGQEYGALEVKNHLERLIFKDIVSTCSIIFSPQMSSENRFSPWVCHFHVCKDLVRRRRLTVHSIIDSLYMHCSNARRLWKIDLPDLQVTNKDCSFIDFENEDDAFCITVTIVECSKSSRIELDVIRDMVIPSILEAVVKGFPEIKKVDILWNDELIASDSHKTARGELYLRVSNMKSAISDTGKTILNEHLYLAANSLSATGEFVSLNSKGLKQQREHAFVSSPFMQACFSNPSACFVKAAKAEVLDDLQGTIAHWLGERSLVLGLDQKLEETVDVYKLLGESVNSKKQDIGFEVPEAFNSMSEKHSSPFVGAFGGSAFDELKKIETKTRSILREFLTLNDVMRLSRELRNILHKYPIDHRVSEADWDTLMMALYFHPRRDEKFGCGAKEIKVVNRPEYPNTRCFSLARTDEAFVDFSYRKCVIGALEVIAPQRAKSFKSRWLQSGS
ncbi:Phosphoenolpyruvate carboxylase-related kinase 1 isoform 1 [Hibiscus syriacus]|uniref:DNA-directed RNA polymerase n=1 Tax=Hibiscus syriacus TaxID=106335 RepID=A0A6A3B572_HIBSY|nr:Phosphoenolpyruvate carboxylase-related kinase 1 isoform 1 [Hibiscus syriacus]